MSEMNMGFLIALVAGLGIKWVIYTGLIWVMIKIQKLNYNFFGLLASSMAAIVTSLIPFVGPYLAYVVLVICLWKCTGAEIAPDIIFTVAIAGALMFCINLWVLAALMPDLRASVNKVETVHASELPTAVEDETPKVESTRSDPVFRPTGNSFNGLVLKGISFLPAHQIAMIGDGLGIHNVKSGETFTVQSEEGPIEVRCEKVNRSSVQLTVGTETVELVLR